MQHGLSNHIPVVLWPLVFVALIGGALALGVMYVLGSLIDRGDRRAA